MKHNYPLLAVFFSALVIQTTNGQNPFSFTNENSKLSNSNFHSGNAVTVADMNGDGLDDIARLDDARDLYYELQRSAQTFNGVHAVSTASNSNCWSMVVADADNDGVRETLVGYNGSVKYVKPNTALTSFPVVTLPNSNFFLQNMNFADIDNNGWADIFGCNDVGTSVMWGNNGSGAFPSTTAFFSPATYPASDNSGNYGTVWTDFDNDGDVDFYVAHCRQGVNSPTDPRRINQLFINDGNNNYALDSFDVHGLNIGAQTWTASFDDIDNDGDFDLFITNHDVSSQLLLNDGTGNFTDISSGSGLVVNITPYQSKMADFDNDGYLDIMVSGDDSRVFHNNHDNTFTLLGSVFDNNSMNSFAVGDLNHDGRLDMYSSYATGYNSPSSVDDVLWLNSTENQNHFITFDLRGTTSTRDALGARIFIYGAFGVKTREVRSGESYGTTNSFMCHFGLGSATGIDSAVIKWPSGIVTHLANHPADQFITVVEGQCISPDNVVTSSTAMVLCGGQPLTLNAVPGYTYLWNTGDTTASITVTNPGEYSVRVTDQTTGCNSVSKTIAVESTPDETPTISITGSSSFCAGDSVVLSSSMATSYLWSNGDTTQSTVIKTTGAYSLTIQGSCAAFTSQVVNVTTVVADVTPIATPSVCEGNSVVLQVAANGTPNWFISDTSNVVLLTGNTFTIPVSQQSVTYYVESRDTAFGISGKVGPEDNSMNNGSLFNGDQYEIFDVYKPVILNTVKVYSGSKKDRTIQLRDASNNVVKQLVVNIDTGEQIVTLNWLLQPGTAYRLGWLAGSQPNLYRNNGNASYPYSINGLVSITSSSAGSSYYYAYYDWNIQEPPLACASSRVPISVTVNPNPVVSLSGLGSQYYESDVPVTLSGTPSGGTFSGAGVNGNVFTPANAAVGGPYTVTYNYTDNNGCSNEDNLQVTVLADTSINTSVKEITEVYGLKVFPNPNNGQFVLSFESKGVSPVELAIQNSLGQLVWEGKMETHKGSNSIQLNLIEISKGYYQLTLRSATQQHSFKLFIQ